MTTADIGAGMLSGSASKCTETAHRVCLIGMMGTGKTTTGRMLAARLGFQFVDSDELLEVRTRCSVSRLFTLEGESEFRKREAALINEISKRQNIVLSTGGGAVLDPATRDALRSRMTVVHLTATIDELYRRTRHDARRPLLLSADPLGVLHVHNEQRAPLYMECAHMSIDTTGKDICTIVTRIIADLDANRR